MLPLHVALPSPLVIMISNEATQKFRRLQANEDENCVKARYATVGDFRQQLEQLESIRIVVQHTGQLIVNAGL
jgi:hypothetical protein